MAEALIKTEPKVSIEARVYRIAWDRKPSWISTELWRALGKRRLPYIGRWENLGVVASSEKGTAHAEFKPRS